MDLNICWQHHDNATSAERISFRDSAELSILSSQRKLFGSVELKTGDVGLIGFAGEAEHSTGTNAVGLRVFSSSHF
jgi:hypothetical protein